MRARARVYARLAGYTVLLTTTLVRGDIAAHVRVLGRVDAAHAELDAIRIWGG